MLNTSLKVGDIINKSWELTKKHFPVFLLIYIIIGMITFLPEATYYGPYIGSIMKYGTAITEEQWMSIMLENGEIGNWLMWILVVYVAVFFINNYLMITYLRMLNGAVMENKVDMIAELKNARHSYWFYIGSYLIYSLITTLGVMCCILPGIYLGIRYMFVPMIVSTNPQITFSEAFNRSWQMTKGNFWMLLWLGIVACFINIIGLLCCCVGIIISIILTYMMYAYAYKLLSTTVSDATVEIIEEIVEQ